jgi:CheY-like chemotaxis protein
MNVGLPGSMDGLEAARICARWPIPVVYLTGHSEPVILKGVRTSGPVLYLRKLVNEQAWGYRRTRPQSSPHRHPEPT